MKLQDINDHNDLAEYFGTSYKRLGRYLYDLDHRYKYSTFSLAKKSGGEREINAPRRRMKNLQEKLSRDLYEVYPRRASVHGFARHKSIVTNAQRHLDKKYIFNIDLLNFFGAIHFGRVRNLFLAEPFGFNHSVATVLAQLCCYNNKLPQGAPTSSILSNMICWKLDAQLQQLAKVTNSTYTRYVDDITFSFTCRRHRLPSEVVILRDEEAGPGHALSEIVNRNGFEINFEKVRLSGINQRQEVTGITVNEFPNVPRKYIKQIGSVLHAWEKYGYDATELKFNESFDTRQRASDKPKSLQSVVKGKLSFLRSVRGRRDPIFQKLAKRFNALVEDDAKKFSIIKETRPEQVAIESLWVLEACYDDENGNAVVIQGTGFVLDDFGLVTCAHVVTENGKLIDKRIKAFQPSAPEKEHSISARYIDHHRDIALCELHTNQHLTSIQIHIEEVSVGLKATLFGFPAYKYGQSASVFDTKVTSIFPQHGIQKFEIDTQIREGNSGGPVATADGRVIGVALEGAKKDSGTNAVLNYSELSNVHVDEYKI